MPHLLHIIRSLVRTPVFSLTAVVSLALGIGANTAMFSMLDRVLLRTLPVKDPHELVFLYHPGPSQGSTSTDEPGGASFSYPMFREMQQQQTPFTGLAGRFTVSSSLAYRNNALPGSTFLVSGNYFSVLGVGPALGRVFSEEDDRVPGGHSVVVLGYGYWKNRFAEDVTMLNQPMIVNGYPMTIVGVAHPRFLSEVPGTTPDVFVPISMQREMMPDRDALSNRQDAWITLFARRKPGTTIEQATTAINVTYRSQLEQDLAVITNPDQEFRTRFRAKKIELKPGDFGRGTLRDSSRTPLMLLMGMTLLVLLIACANVANLQLARATARTREVAVRIALGASRRQLIRQLLTESCVIAVAGGLLGLLVAYWTLRGILVSLPARQSTTGVITADLNLRMLFFCLALSIVTGIVFGLYPALHASKSNLAVTLKDQNNQATASKFTGFFRRSLVTMQMAISLLLLISAALFAKTLVNLSSVDLGLRPDHLVTLSLNPRLNRYTPERTAQFYDQLAERLAALPGVTLVAAARVLPVSGSSSSTNITVEGYTPEKSEDNQCRYNDIGPDYFRTLGIPLVAGREFTASDNTAAAPPTVIVNESFARHYFGGQNPVGRRFARGSGDKIQYRTIIGMVKDSKYSDVRETIPRAFYLPYRAISSLSTLNLFVRTSVAPESLMSAVRAQVAAIDPNLPLRNLRTMEAVLESRMSNERLLWRLTGVFGGLATILAAVGLYGVLAFNIGRRTREIGIRIALGARAGHVRGLVVREVALMLGIGSIIGIAAAGGVSQLVKGTLFGVEPLDPVTYLSAAAALGIIALAAAYIPARRATSVDPLVALRYE